MRAMPHEQLEYRIDEVNGDAHDRGVCTNCGAHVPCRIGLATVAGCCSVCGSVGIEPIGSGSTMNVGPAVSDR
jgi:hypothetical protein